MRIEEITEETQKETLPVWKLSGALDAAQLTTRAEAPATLDLDDINRCDIQNLRGLLEFIDAASLRDKPVALRVRRPKMRALLHFLHFDLICRIEPNHADTIFQK